MLAQRRPDEQVYVGPTSVSNVGPTESTTEKLRWPNVVMLSGSFPQTIRDWNDLPESLISSSELSDDSVSKFTSLVRARD